MRKGLFGFALPHLAALTLGAASLGLAGMGAAHAEPVGELRCTAVGATGLLVVSKGAITCTYYRRDGIVEFYTGSTSRFGLDIGPGNAYRLAFTVSNADLSEPAALQGNFVGAQVGLPAGEGFTASALVGGRGATLIPARISRYTGINITAGLNDLQLVYAGSERHELHSRY